MKKAFTLVELIFVIVILAIISMFGTNLYTQIYTSYTHTRAINQLENRTQSAVNIIAARLEDRVRGTVIARDLNNRADFDALNAAQVHHDVLEWIGQSTETKYIGNNRPGWSGFIDIESAPSAYSAAAFTLNTQGSTLNSIVAILTNLGAPRVANFGVLFKSAVSDMYSNIQTAYGFDGANADLIAIGSVNNNEILNITSYTGVPDPSRGGGLMQEFSDQYYLAHTAYAIVPSNVANNFLGIANAKNFDISLHYNYQPWQGDTFAATNNGPTPNQLLARDASLFKFRDDNGAVVFKLCLRDNGRNIDPNQMDLVVCKSQVVY